MDLIDRWKQRDGADDLTCGLIFEAMSKILLAFADGPVQQEQPKAFPIMMDLDQAERWTHRAEQKRRGSTFVVAIHVKSRLRIPGCISN